MRLAMKIALGLAAIVSTTHAAEPVQPTVSKAAYLFDSNTGKLTNGGALVIEGDKIKAIGTQGAPASAKVIEMC